MSFGKLFVI